MSRVAIVRGPHKGEVLEHDIAASTTFVRARRDEAGTPRDLAVYRIFSRAVDDDRDRADLYAAEWCAEHEAFRDRCPHVPPSPTRRWVRFGRRFDQTALEAGAPGARESKWHQLLRADQPEEPWLTICDFIVYGPIREQYQHPTLTPIGVPMCRHCKRLAGVEERLVLGSRGMSG